MDALPKLFPSADLIRDEIEGRLSGTSEAVADLGDDLPAPVLEEVDDDEPAVVLAARVFADAEDEYEQAVLAADEAAEDLRECHNRLAEARADLLRLGGGAPVAASSAKPFIRARPWWSTPSDPPSDAEKSLRRRICLYLLARPGERFRPSQVAKRLHAARAEVDVALARMAHGNSGVVASMDDGEPVYAWSPKKEEPK